MILRNRYTQIGLAISLGLVLAYINRFTLDDAFISFRYAENLAHGHGLVFNPNEQPVEGYTNFLWTVLLSGWISLGVNPVTGSHIMSLTFLLIALFMTYALSKQVLENHFQALLTTVFLGTNYTFFCFGTSGLETQFQTALHVGLLYLFFPIASSGASDRNVRIGMSVLSTTALLTRLDSALVVVPVLAGTCVVLLREKSSWKIKAIQLSQLMLPLGFMLGVWFLWKIGYYGDILPNTFYAKGQSSSLRPGLMYLWTFFRSYLLLPIIVLFFIQLKSFFRPQNRFLVWILGIATLWMAYILKVGGDFMEFRFMVPILPMIFTILTWTIFQIRFRWIRALFIVLIFGGVVHHHRTFVPYAYGMESITTLKNHLIDEDEQWINIGKILGNALQKSPDVLIALSPVGAIPYYSGLKTIDMYGLNDRWIIQNGLSIADERPGHQRYATLNYLLKRKVNLLISHPVVLDQEGPINNIPDLSHHFVGDFTTNIIAVPLPHKKRLIVTYLNSNAAVDQAILNNGWKIYQMNRTGDQFFLREYRTPE